LDVKILNKINDNEISEVDRILQDNKDAGGNLISLLQRIQDYFGYVPANIVFYVSNRLKIPPAEILSVATFYTQFKLTEKGKNVITCCDGTACHVKGSPLLLNYFENTIGIKPGETTEDKIFTLESVACLGCCAISPVCIINGQIYGNLTLKKVKKLFKSLVKEK